MVYRFLREMHIQPARSRSRIALRTQTDAVPLTFCEVAFVHKRRDDVSMKQVVIAASTQRIRDMSWPALQGKNKAASESSELTLPLQRYS